MEDRIDRRLSVAPMMDCTDRHCRYFLRLISRDVLLYTEMITAHAIKHGETERLLGFHESEHPVALQIGGSDPDLLAKAARAGESFGYDEINLNVGCPSDRVHSGRFGACLMAEPELVADCISAMRESVRVPVTVKCRLGINDRNDYGFLSTFVAAVADAGCEVFNLHARVAILGGISPKENREIPPLNYPFAYRLKSEYPHLKIVLNGGVLSVAACAAHLSRFDGVMIGREAYRNPWILAEAGAALFGRSMPARGDIVQQMAPYIEDQLGRGHRLGSITRHMLGLYSGQPGARRWRRTLTEGAAGNAMDASMVLAAIPDAVA
jgi:tRNA-dihydrouridine synthase A